jgi:N-acetylglutamate synthase-like GNAT family acetyltransferase
MTEIDDTGIRAGVDDSPDVRRDDSPDDSPDVGLDAGSDVRIRRATEPGDLGAVVALHGRLYTSEYGMDQTMEAYSAVGIGGFLLDRLERGSEAGELWVAEQDGRIVGAVSMQAEEGRGRLRWLVLDAAVRGRGVGRRLVELSLDYARERGFPGVFLTTVAGLDAAHGIYRKAGFELAGSAPMAKWGIETLEQRFDLEFG